MLPERPDPPPSGPYPVTSFKFEKIWQNFLSWFLLKHPCCFWLPHFFRHSRLNLCPDLPFQPLWRLDQIQSRHPAQPLAPFLRRGGHLLLELQRLGLRLKARLRRVNPLYLQFHPFLQSEAPPLSRRGPIFYLPSSNLACACVKPIAASCSLFGITPAESSALPLSASKLSLYFFAVIVVWP